jgi:rSAM/selenodomain-associated transferase 1
MENALIILVRNPEKGTVTTGFANDIGEYKNQQVYRFLLQHTRDISLSCNCSHFVFYSSYIHAQDVFDDHLFTKFLQEGQDDGQKMMNAISKVFELGCRKVCVIRTDCYELETEILNEAFEKLGAVDVVLGPSSNGGCYLLGVKQLHAPLFQINWSGAGVFDQAIEVSKNNGLTYAELQVLKEILSFEDLLETNILTHIREGDLEE